MNRHAFMMDLLRPDITNDELVQILNCKQELNSDDLQQIVDTAVKIIFAANKVLEDK